MEFAAESVVEFVVGYGVEGFGEIQCPYPLFCKLSKEAKMSTE